MMVQIRALLLALLSALTALGLLPQDVHDLLHANTDAILAGLFAAWAVFAGLRARKDRAVAP
jgi:hypothetical protein